MGLNSILYGVTALKPSVLSWLSMTVHNPTVLPLPRTRQVLEGTHRPFHSSPYRHTTSPQVITSQCNTAIFTFYDHLDNVLARSDSACFTVDDRPRNGAVLILTHSSSHSAIFVAFKILTRGSSGLLHRTA